MEIADKDLIQSLWNVQYAKGYYTELQLNLLTFCQLDKSKVQTTKTFSMSLHQNNPIGRLFPKPSIIP